MKLMCIWCYFLLQYARIVQKLGFPARFKVNAFALLIRSESKMFPDHLDSMGSGDMQDFKIQNMVGSCDVKFPIRLEGLALASGNFANVRIYSSAISNIWSLIISSVQNLACLALPNLILLKYLLTCYPSWYLTVWAGDFPWADLPHGRPQDRDPRLRLWQGRPHWSQGAGTDIHCLWEHIPDARAVQETAV